MRTVRTLWSARDCLKQDWSDTNLIVFGTVKDHPWLQEFAERLPFRYGKGQVQLGAQTYRGQHLRVIAAIRHPANAERRAVLYTAADASDVAGINDVFHGPTEFVVADGSKSLVAANYSLTGDLTPAAMQTDLRFSLRINCWRSTPPPSTARQRSLRRHSPMPAKRSFGLYQGMSSGSCSNRITLSLHDAHTTMQPVVTDAILDLPIDWLAEGLVVTTDTGQLQRGDTLVSLGDHTPSQLLEKLRQWIPAENDHWLRAKSAQALRNLAVLQALEIADQFPVQVTIQRGDQVHEISIPQGHTTPQAPGPWVRWQVHPEQDLGVFTLDRCQVNDQYLNTLREFFEAVQKNGISRVAFDVRANSGGNSKVCDEFLRYIELAEYDGYSAAVRYSEDAIAQRGYGDAVEPGYIEYDSQTMVNDPHSEISLFDGDLFVLTSKQTFSSGTWIAIILKDNGLAEIVGEPSGGAPSSYGDILLFSLPETAFSFSVSYKQWLRPDRNADETTVLEPDHYVPMTAADLRAQRDPVLEYLLSQ